MNEENKYFLSLRCRMCNKLLLKEDGFTGTIQIKCNNCKQINEFSINRKQDLVDKAWLGVSRIDT